MFGFATFEGSVYAAGNFSGKVARWEGGQWATVGGAFNDDAYILHAYQGVLYVGGWFTRIGSVSANYIARWNGTAWNSVADVALNGYVYAMVNYEDDLVVGGPFYDQPFDRVARWDGAVWSSLGTGFSGAVLGLCVYRGALVAGGSFTFTGDGSVALNRTAMWNGNAWLPMSSGMTGGTTRVSAFIESPDGSLLAGGHFQRADGLTANKIARWDGVAWTALTAGGTDNEIKTMVYFRGALVIGGRMNLAGTTAVNEIAELQDDGQGQTWSNVGGGVTGGYDPVFTGVSELHVTDSLL